MKSFFGAGGGGSAGSFKQRPDTLRSNDTFEGLVGLCAGPIVGPTRGLKSITIDGTPIEDESGKLNFEHFVTVVADGDPAKFPQLAKLQLGAGAAPVSVGLSLTNPNPTAPGPWVTKTINNTGADALDLRFVVSQLFRQNKSGIFETSARLEIELKPVGSTTWVNPYINNPGGGYSEDGVSLEDGRRLLVPRSYYNAGGTSWGTDPNAGYLAINGKTTSPYVYELRLKVPSTGIYANKAWDVRARLVDRETLDADPNFEKRTVQWESIAAVYNDQLGDHEDWRGLAWMSLFGKASDQLTGVPEVLVETDAKVVQVPPLSVFDPTSRVYTTATWDGSFARAWTNDPAWIINDALSDSLSGLSRLAPGSFLNKWDALEASKWFSARVPNGDGGSEPRYSLNVVSKEAQAADEFIQYLAGAVGGFAWDEGNGEWRLKIDKPETPVDIFTLENIEGEFSYSTTEIDTRFNDITMSFANAEMGYREDRVRVFDQAHIDKFGRKPSTLAAVGCTGRQEALRRAMLRLRSATRETRMVSFVTNRRGRLLERLSTILVADKDLGFGSGAETTGRAISLDGTTVNLRDPLRLELGVNYVVKIAVPDDTYPADAGRPTKVIARTVTNTGAQRGDVTTLYLDAALPNDTPENVALALEADGLPAIPKLYRVLDMDPDDDGERVAISAIEIDTGKWPAADNVDEAAILGQTADAIVPPPLVPDHGPIASVFQITTDTGLQNNLVLNWRRPSSLFISGFQVTYALNGGNKVTLADGLQDTTVTLVSPTPGDYRFEVTSKDRRGRVSQPLVAILTVLPDGSLGLMVEGSSDNGSTWHMPPVDGDTLWRFSLNGGATWDDPINVSAADTAEIEAELDLIRSDGWLSAGEKPTVIRAIQAINDEYSGLASQAQQLNVTAERTAYLNARTAFINYLNSLSPAWNNAELDTPIDPAAFKTAEAGYYSSRTALIARMTQAAGGGAATTVTNRVKFSLFERGTTGWARRTDPSNIQSDALTRGLNGAVPYVGLKAIPTASGQYISIGTDTVNGFQFPVTSQERLCVYLGFQTYGPCSQQQINLWGIRANGTTFLAASWQRSGTHSFDDRWLNFLTVPADMVQGYLECYAFSSGAGSSSNKLDLAVTYPLVCSVPSYQTSAPTFVPGPNAEDGATEGAPAGTLIGGQLAEYVRDAAAAGLAIDTAIGENNTLSKDEKKRIQLFVNTLNASSSSAGSVDAIRVQLEAFGLSSASTTLNNAWRGTSGLFTYLNSTGNYASTNVNTTISRTTLSARQKAFDDALQAALAAIAAYNANLASESSADNAFTDSLFQRRDSDYDWATFTSTASVSNTNDGPYVYFVASSSYGRVIETRRKPCQNGDRIDVEFTYYCDGGTGGSTQFGAWVQLYNVDGSLASGGNVQVIGVVYNSALKGQWVTVRGSLTVATDATYYGVYLECQGGQTGSAGNNRVCMRKPRASRIPPALQYINVNGRQTNPLLTSAFVVSSSVQLSGLTTSVTNNSITLSNFSANFGQGNVSITGGTVSGLSASTRYYFWLLAPNMSNTGRSFSVSTSFTGNSDPQRIYIGYATTAATSGGTGSTGGGGGSGGGEWCVDGDAWLLDGIQAKDAVAGSPIDLMLEDGSGFERATIDSVEHAVSACVELVSASGIRLTCSVTTPMQRLDGSLYLAPDAAGELIAVHDAAGWRWERCVSAEPAGPRTVARIHVGGRVYLAGETPSRRIATHNPAVKP